MRWRSLDGVISGEHGIGITKLDYLTDAEMANYWAYKQGRPGRPLQPRQADEGRQPRQRLHAST
jgi:hypothetical protein